MKKLLINKLEGCPVAIFEPKYKKIRKDIFKNKYGIYALFDKKGIYYVGRGDVECRLKDHLTRNRHSEKWDYFSVYFTATTEMATALEAIILSIYSPKGNKQSSKVEKVVKNKEKMKRKVEKQMKEIDDEHRQFRKPGISAKNKKGKGNRANKGVRVVVSQGMTQRRFQLKDFFSNGFLRGPQTLKAEYKAKPFYAVLLPSGEIEYQGKKYSSPSHAAMVAKRSKSENGWNVWKIQNSSNKWITLNLLKSEASGFKAKSKPIDKAS